MIVDSIATLVIAKSQKRKPPPTTISLAGDLARAKEQARTACPRVDTKPPGPAKTIGKKSKQTNTLTAHPALAAGTEETCVVCLEKERTHCYIPCGHICICTDCINHPGCQMQCPICKGPGTLQRIFNA